MTTRKQIVAGNWKMHMTREPAVALATKLVDGLRDGGDVEVVVIPPTCLLTDVRRVIEASPIALGAQNLHPAVQGAFTGEVSAPMLRSIGCTYVLCGHSERRQHFGDTPEWVGEKVAAAHRDGLTPILCVGETLDEREAGRTEAVVEAQLTAGLAKLDRDQVAQTVVAYEPVWAIGTGRNASPEQAQEVHAFIRARLRERHGDAVADRVRVQYGGSVKPDNAARLLAQPDIDGALVGGASLDAESFLNIVAAAR